MSNYKPYPAYKDSGVEWLERVPEHWDTQRIRSLIDSAQNGIWGDDPDGGVDDIPCARVADFDRNNFTVKGELPTLRKVPEAQRLSRQVNPGDLLIEKSGGGEQTTVGVVVQYQGVEPVICSNFVAVVKPKKGVFPRWLCYTNAHLYSVGVNVRSIKQTTGIQNIDSDQYFSERVAVPPESERQAISAHLDRETARIDALIEKKTRFIELLREKRQALITHAVTKGLDPSVKMKDSGVEWLGAVPEHWGVKPLKLLVKEGSTISYGIVQPGEPLDEGVPFVQTTNMSSGDFEIESLQKTTPEIAAGFPRSRLTGGEVILGIRASIGAAFVVPMHLAGVNLSRGVARIDCSSQLSSHFFVAYLSSMAVDGYWQLAKQGSTFNEVSIATVKELLVPVPPREEQAEIEEMLSNATARLNSIFKKTERSIELLKERRSALITAAVTGQIDLREAV
ncbi:restriction endonuclease subunit S [Stutzerimonas nitrititolerans]|uniref:restriction endonuclease subunit S n=1 Tax=Stutzerimonas nitrititolerans TaxID=2482751 RepID=UPI0028AFD1D3|nr:restriction endonuclease subunit S [Stutzerimonas nitrititolerans]